MFNEFVTEVSEPHFSSSYSSSSSAALLLQSGNTPEPIHVSNPSSKIKKQIPSVIKRAYNCMQFPHSILKAKLYPFASTAIPASSGSAGAIASSSTPKSRTQDKVGEHMKKLCKKERRKQLPSGLLVCSACITVHQEVFFEEDQKERIPERRKCKGSNYILTVCSHNKEMTWSDVHDVLERGEGVAYCDGEGGSHMHGLLPSVLANIYHRDVVMVRDEDGVVTVRKQLVLAHIPTYIHRYPELLLRRRLEQLKEYEQILCPHVKSTDAEIHFPCSPILSRFRHWEAWCMCCNSSHACPISTCETEWRVIRRKGEGAGSNDEIVLDVVRRLGRMEEGETKGREGILGERWLSQVAEEVEEGGGKAWQIIERLERAGLKFR